MSSRSRLAWAVLMCTLGVAAATERADAARRTRTAQTTLASDPEFRVKGRIKVQRQEATKKLPERETLEVSLSRLVKGGTYSLWADDPTDGSESLVRIPPYDFVPKGNRTAVLRFGGTSPQSLPFGATLADLAARRVQVRDASGHVVVVGPVPAIRAVQ
ncbi:MAG: hypothetical protein K8T90_06470 [Planctomycetes bacterium]|nr:hypothetical protein [Planctomycetota bacterium]